MLALADPIWRNCLRPIWATAQWSTFRLSLIHIFFYKVPIKAFIAAVFHIVAEGQPVSAIHQVIVVAAEKQAQLGPKFTVGNEVKVNSSIDELLHAFIGFAEDFIKSRGLVAVSYTHLSAGNPG